MKYLMKSGTLYDPGGRPVMAMRKSPFSVEKQICRPDGSCILHTGIRTQTENPERMGDVRSRTYYMEDSSGRETASANPAYAPEEDPETVGWPVCRMPRADRAAVKLQGRDCILTMQNSQNYIMTDGEGKTLLQILHRGIMGGWTLEEGETLAPEILCGLFAFCRYLEQENELMIV